RGKAAPNAGDTPEKKPIVLFLETLKKTIPSFALNLCSLKREASHFTKKGTVPFHPFPNIKKLYTQWW
ncbi:MAG: hypothetical protein O3A59_08490, partial [Nitrospirae bacterium]|nr:hypothetical protein [Nitrospirota bacterium]